METFGRLACSLTQRQVNEVLARVQAGARKACAEIGKYSTKNVDFTGAADLLIAAFERGVDRSIGWRRKPGRLCAGVLNRRLSLAR